MCQAFGKSCQFKDETFKNVGESSTKRKHKRVNVSDEMSTKQKSISGNIPGKISMKPSNHSPTTTKKIQMANCSSKRQY